MCKFIAALSSISTVTVVLLHLNYLSFRLQTEITDKGLHFSTGVTDNVMNGPTP